MVILTHFPHYELLVINEYLHPQRRKIETRKVWADFEE